MLGGDRLSRSEYVSLHAREAGPNIPERDRCQNTVHQQYLRTGRVYNTQQEKFFPYDVDDNIPKLKINIGCQPVHAVIDTGATKSIMSSQCLLKIFGENYERFLRRTKVCTYQADGTPLEILGQLNLEFKIGNVVYNTLFLVFKNEKENGKNQKHTLFHMKRRSVWYEYTVQYGHNFVK